MANEKTLELLKEMKADPKAKELFEGMEKPTSPDEAISAYAQVAEKLGYGITEKDIREAIKQEETKRKAKSIRSWQAWKNWKMICIQNCSSKICNIFSHSPVFRVGGDEFIVFLSGDDYYRRNELMNQINAIPKDRSKIRAGETVSAGMAEYDRDKHRSLLSVFEDADNVMYARKQYLKETVLKKEDKPDSEAVSDYIPVIHARKHVLVVDDIEMNREIMGDLLSEDYDISGTKKRTDFNLGHDGNEISLILFAT